MNLTSLPRFMSAAVLSASLSACGDKAFYNPDPNGNSNNVLDASENDAGRYMPPPDAAQSQVENCLRAYDTLRASVQFTYRLTRAANTLGSPFTLSPLTEAIPGDAGTTYPFSTHANYAGIPTGAVPPPPLPGMEQQFRDSLRALEALRGIQAPVTGTVTPQASGGCLVSMAWVFPTQGLPFVRGTASGDAGVVAYTTSDPAAVTRVPLVAPTDGGNSPVNMTFTAPSMTGEPVVIRDVPVCGVSGVPNCATSGDRVVVDIRFGARVTPPPSDGGVLDAARD